MQSTGVNLGRSDATPFVHSMEALRQLLEKWRDHQGSACLYQHARAGHLRVGVDLPGTVSLLCSVEWGCFECVEDLLRHSGQKSFASLLGILQLGHHGRNLEQPLIEGEEFLELGPLSNTTSARKSGGAPGGPQHVGGPATGGSSSPDRKLVDKFQEVLTRLQQSAVLIDSMPGLPGVLQHVQALIEK